jgi:hypothetical protein
LFLISINKRTAIFAFLLFIPLLLRLISTPTANISFFLLAFYATLGRAQAIQALSMTWLLTMISPGLAPGAPLGSVGRYFVFLGAFVSVFIRSGVFSGRYDFSKIVLATVSLGVFFIIHALFISPIPDVSILKAASWMIVTSTLCSAWSGLSIKNRDKLFKQLYLGLVAIIIVSLPLLLLPLGYLRNGSGFQGILNHPQAFGPAVAILGAIAGSKLLTQPKPSWAYLGMFTLAVMLIMASESRTAGLALMIGLFFAIAMVVFFHKGTVKAELPSLYSRRTWGVVSVLLCLGLFFLPQIIEKTDYYMSKSGRAASNESIAEVFDKSRGGLIDKMMLNIGRHPFTGIGFGIASEADYMVVERDPILGLPISAAVEKGVLPLVIVEELGFFGASLVFIWLIYLVRSALKAGAVSLTLIGVSLLINMGESIFFSPGGLGMLTLICISWAGTSQEAIKFKNQ